MKTIFSGVQPTGNIHIGNYLGAIKNWKNIISQTPGARFFFSIVDLHAITIRQEPSILRESIIQTFAMYLACGITGDNVTIFQQSTVKQHAELAWILSCNVQMGFLDRMTQYKEKTHDNKERACLGLYSYPVLMAADILLYKTNLVPVGEDQIQHIELTRDIALKFNSNYEKDVLTIPEYSLTKARRVMSLRDGVKKMSKSDESDFSRINILDDADTILKKIQKAKSGEVEMQNLGNVYEAITGSKLTIEEGKSFAFKQAVADVIIAELMPIQKQFCTLMEDKSQIVKLMEKGTDTARGVAESNLNEIYKVVGLR